MNNNLITLSKAIKKAGGITSWSDLEKVEIIRKVPIGKGGGKKKAIINLLPFLDHTSNSNNIRIFDGDKIFIRKFTTKDPSIVSKSILVGVSPKFIKVSIFRRVEAPDNITTTRSLFIRCNKYNWSNKAFIWEISYNKVRFK